MSANKLLNQWGLMGATEAAYGTAAALTPASDGILAMDPPRIAQEYAHDGSRNGSGGGTGGQIQKTSKSGRSGRLAILSEFVGPGAAYAAGVRSSIHTLLRACGHAAALTTTVDSEKYVYTPIATGFVSATLKPFIGGQSQVLRGAYGSLSISAEGPAVPAFNFEMMGLADAIEDEVIPAITYPNLTLNPPKSENIGLMLDAWAAAVVRSWSFTQNFELSPRLDDNSSGHAGFSPGKMDPKMEVTVEAAPLATFNPYQLAEDATPFALALQVGSTQYNRFKLAAATVQIDDVQDEADGPTALWTLSLSLRSSSPAATDMYSITTD